MALQCVIIWVEGDRGRSERSLSWETTMMWKAVWWRGLAQEIQWQVLSSYINEKLLSPSELGYDWRPEVWLQKEAGLLRLAHPEVL